jgi:YVTN family beta-propeller protein
MRTAVLLTGVALAGCTASANAVEPPNNHIYFPTGMAVAPDDSVLFVADANSDLTYDSGSISVVDLDVVDMIASAWTTGQTVPSDCTQDPNYSETLVCPDTSEGFLLPDAGVRVGNFATDIAVQDTGAATGTNSLRLIVPTRGDPSVAWADYDGTKLSCASTDESFPLCDDAHRLTYVQNNPNIGELPPEPFNVFADSLGQFAVVTSLSTGDVTLIDSPPGADAVIADIAVGYFQPDPTTGLLSSSGVAGRPAGGAADIVYVGSANDDRVQTFTVGRPIDDASPYLIPGDFFFLDEVGENAGSSNNTRGMRFNSDGSKLYMVNRNPASLQIYDTADGPDGYPLNVGTGASDICRNGSTLTVLDSGDGDRAYVTCFQDGQVYVIDPTGLSTVIDIINVGRGPYAIAAAPTRKKIYVTNFLEDTIAVIDVSPTSMLRDHVILRIGVPLPPDTGTTL